MKQLVDPIFKITAISDWLRTSNALMVDLTDSDTTEGDLMRARKLAKFIRWATKYKIALLMNKGRVPCKMNRKAHRMHELYARIVY